MVNYGYIKLHREILNHWIYGLDKNGHAKEPFTKCHAWIDLLLQANFATTKRLYKGKVQYTYAGQLQTSINFLAERWGWNKKRVIRFLSLLENDGMITKNGYAHGTTITIENWDKFQVDGNTEGYTHGYTGGSAHGYTDGSHNKKGIRKDKEYPPKSPQGEEGEGWKIAFENLMKEWELEGR